MKIKNTLKKIKFIFYIWFFKNFLYFIYKINRRIERNPNFDLFLKILFKKKNIARIQKIAFSSNYNYILAKYFYKKNIYILSILFLFNWQKFDKNSIEFLNILFLKTQLYPSFILGRLTKGKKGIFSFNEKDIYSSTIIPLWSASYSFQKLLLKINMGCIDAIIRKPNSTSIKQQKSYSIFASQTEFIEFFIVHSILLYFLGYNINFYYTEYQNPQSENREDYEEIFRLEMKYLKRLFKHNISFILVGETFDNLPFGIKKSILVLSLTDTMYYCKDISFNSSKLYNHLKNYKKTNLFKLRLKRNFIVASFFYKKFIEKRDNSVWIFHNGANIESGALHKVLEFFKIDYFSIEISLFRNCFFVSFNKLVINLDTKNAWKVYSYDEENSKTKLKVKTIIRTYSKKAGNLQNAFQNFEKIQKVKMPSKFNYVLLGNFPFETRYYQKNTGKVFSNQLIWLKETITFLNKLDCNIIYRPHPYEIVFDADKSLKTFSKIRKIFNNQKNLFVFDQLKFNTYSLFELKNTFFIIYDSDIGLELILKGKNIITAEKTHYSHLNLCENIKSKKEYFDILCENFNNIEYSSLTNKKIALKYLTFWNTKIMIKRKFGVGNSIEVLKKLNREEIIELSHSRFYKILTEKRKYIGNHV